jgi:hypothetical protein
VKRKAALPPSSLGNSTTTTSSATLFAERQQNRAYIDRSYFSTIAEESPMRLPMGSPGPRLLDQQTPDGWPGLDDSFDMSFVGRELGFSSSMKSSNTVTNNNSTAQAVHSADNKENAAV